MIEDVALILMYVLYYSILFSMLEDIITIEKPKRVKSIPPSNYHYFTMGISGDEK